MVGSRLRQSIVAALLVVLAALGYFTYLGFFGGPLFRLVPASAPASQAEQGTVAVFFSSDMGFNTGMGLRVPRRLAAQGIPVVAVNSLTAFAPGRTPQQAAALVRQAVARASAIPGARHILLIGQSFGANVVLAAEPTLPPELRSRIALVSLIVPGDTMLFRATPGGVFDYRHDGPALPYARRLDDRPVLCISGEDEPGSLCPIWQQHNVRTVALPGDHYLLRDAPLVAATLERGLMDVVERRLTIAAAATPRIPQSAASPRP